MRLFKNIFNHCAKGDQAASLLIKRNVSFGQSLSAPAVFSTHFSQLLSKVFKNKFLLCVQKTSFSPDTLLFVWWHIGLLLFLFPLNYVCCHQQKSGRYSVPANWAMLENRHVKGEYHFQWKNPVLNHYLFRCLTFTPSIGKSVAIQMECQFLSFMADQASVVTLSIVATSIPKPTKSSKWTNGAAANLHPMRNWGKTTP